jgi:hypothetical protein
MSKNIAQKKGRVSAGLLKECKIFTALKLNRLNFQLN